jgi:3-carboxy-cis,cis-muconate cycloisomerase
MRANLDAAGGLPLAEHVTTVLAPALGRLAAHELVAAASVRAASQGITLPEALLADGPAAATLRDAGIGPAELAAAADPDGYLGAAAEFVRRALAAHSSRGE